MRDQNARQVQHRKPQPSSCSKYSIHVCTNCGVQFYTDGSVPIRKVLSTNWDHALSSTVGLVSRTANAVTKHPHQTLHAAYGWERTWKWMFQQPRVYLFKQSRSCYNSLIRLGQLLFPQFVSSFNNLLKIIVLYLSVCLCIKQSLQVVFTSANINNILLRSEIYEVQHILNSINSHTNFI